ncbi:aspartyl-tRNA(Asn)/glutamyl-tRNA(Gln) amidotransferase subunit A (plasmid) [Salipiger profundus]|jgi:AtzE family amidohydrolase|uniref:Aspartyl-tRNA(Asn)/glutamyl-tRNA(Gln) amidotransferase subunit A n=1 Tax=Salipiger profundus TaxID=1229727 RepID=A0A1U7DCP4_9RHOB|nr:MULTISPECIES: AtzE family amidohydrolase [Salipiger]APX25931.1 aspartyl-tRNA(Asn)/glutamyl-tRNA(Gln) amidotransferase subunit A [Salipiger profundus]SFC83166.1 aspartyl-tRNA(Asn)/glutamyl-tRNA(Gln) amidotransferase subunit A [Salipiger profundus]
MTAWIDLSAHEIAAAVRSGRMTARGAVEAALARIEKTDSALVAFTTVTGARALETANRIDARISAGEDPGPLAGVPFAVKDLVDVAGVITRAGSRINMDNAPAAADAPVVTRLEAAGAILVGALNMGEYAYDFTGENDHFGSTRNPHDPERRSGGSSGGSGAATAAGMVPLTVGSDTNGSIRVPSSWCGLFGLKATYGRIPRSGTFPFVDSLDHIGPMARSVQDLALALEAMQGSDAGDPASVPRPPCAALETLDQGIGGLRIARGSGELAATEGVAKNALDRVCAALGVTLEADLPGAATARASAALITAVEGAATHAEAMQTRPEDFGRPMRDRLLAGALVPGVAYVRAQRLRRQFAEDAAEVFRHVDAILTPTTPFPAPRIDSDTLEIDGREQPYRKHIGIFTQPISFIGLPVVSVPVQNAAGPLPLGIQIIAPAWREDVALRIARTLELSGTCAAPVPAFEETSA